MQCTNASERLQISTHRLQMVTDAAFACRKRLCLHPYRCSDDHALLRRRNTLAPVICSPFRNGDSSACEVLCSCRRGRGTFYTPPLKSVSGRSVYWAEPPGGGGECSVSGSASVASFLRRVATLSGSRKLHVGLRVIIINNNNTHAIVYGAVIMTTAIARVHPVHLMNAD